MCVAQIFRVPFHVDFVGRCVFFIQVSILSNTIYSTHNHHRYVFISNNVELPLLYIRTIKQTNAGDLVNSVYTLAQPAMKYAIKTEMHGKSLYKCTYILISVMRPQLISAATSRFSVV